MFLGSLSAEYGLLGGGGAVCFVCVCVYRIVTLARSKDESFSSLLFSHNLLLNGVDITVASNHTLAVWFEKC